MQLEGLCNPYVRQCFISVQSLPRTPHFTQSESQSPSIGPYHLDPVPPLPSSALTTLASLLFLDHTKHAPFLGPLQLLTPLPGILPKVYMSYFFASFRFLLKCHFMKDAITSVLK